MSVRRILLLASLIAAALLAPVADSRDLPRITAILSTDAPPYRQHLERFRQKLPSTITTIVLPADTADFEPHWDGPPNLVLALGSRAATWASQRKLPAPLVFSMVYDPADEGLSAGPGQCGLALRVPLETRLSALETLRPTSPHLRIGVLHDPAAGPRELEELKQALAARGYELVVREVPTPDKLEKSLDQLLPRVDVLWLLFEKSLIPDEDVLRDHVLRPAVDAKVAVMGLSDPYAQMGALLAVSVDIGREGEHAAKVAQSVLEGRSPQEIGIEQPEFVIWSLNLNVAREIGWEVPALARKRFERVYR